MTTETAPTETNFVAGSWRGGDGASAINSAAKLTPGATSANLPRSCSAASRRRSTTEEAVFFASPKGRATVAAAQCVVCNRFTPLAQAPDACRLQSLGYPARLAFYIAIGFVIGMVAIAVAAVTGYFFYEAGIEMMSEI